MLSLRNSKIAVTKEKERRKRKSVEREKRRREKSNSYTLNLYNSYWTFCVQQKTVGPKGPIGDNVFKNPARYVSMH